MQDIIEPIIHKAALADLSMALKSSGLSIGDTARLRQTDDGRIAVFAQIERRILFLRYHREAQIGHLGPKATEILTPFLQRDAYLRIRIVGLTPEHLATDGKAEMHISVWGNLRHSDTPLAAPPQKNPMQQNQTRPTKNSA